MGIHEAYDRLSSDERLAVDNAYGMMHDYFKEQGIATAGDDRAERVVEAMARYIEECRK